MSRIGKRPVSIPTGVTVQISGEQVQVEGPKGKLQLRIHPRMKVQVGERDMTVTRPTNTTRDKSLHGLTRTLLNNMVHGVTEEFVKRLEIEGIGFRAELRGKTLQMQLGFSHPISYSIPDGVKVEVPKPTVIHVKGPDKALVGQVAAKIRSFYEPEPYKGKGVRYTGESIRRKAGKAAG